VAFTVDVTQPTGQSSAFSLDFGDNTSSFPFAVPPPVSVPPHDYPPGDWTATLTTILPEGCPNVTAQVHVPPCDCGPAITGITFVDGDCDAQGNRQVTATVQGGPAGTVYWQWVGLDPSFRMGAQSDTKTLPGGTSNQLVNVEIVLGPCIAGPFQASHDVPPCGAPCPSVTSLTATPNSGTTPLTVTLRATIVNVAQATSITWNFGDGSPTVTGGTTQIHTYTSTVAKTFTATVTVEDGPQCATVQGTATVTVSPGSTGNGGKTACGIARLGLALLFALFFVSLAGWACLTWPWEVPLAFGVAIVVLLVVWIVFCKPTICEILLTIWQTLFVSAIALWYVNPCLAKAGSTFCTLLSWAWLAALVLSLGVLLWWALRKDCDVGLCQILNGLLGAIGDASAALGAIYGALTYIMSIFPGCTVNAGVPVLLGVLTFVLMGILRLAHCTIDPFGLSASSPNSPAALQRQGCCK
jgi:PKD repeat protein